VKIEKSEKEIVASKTYHGFEDAADLERDISEVWEEMGMPGEFQGDLEVRLIYRPAMVTTCGGGNL